jgi:hypothetical protein
MKGPGYWMYETGGALRPAIGAYLNGDVLDDEQIALIRAYLAQWIMVGEWAPGSTLDSLRARIGSLKSRQAIAEWLGLAEQIGIDPI